MCDGGAAAPPTPPLVFRIFADIQAPFLEFESSLYKSSLLRASSLLEALLRSVD